MKRIDLIHANGSRDEFESSRDRHSNFAESLLPQDEIAQVVKDAGIISVTMTKDVIVSNGAVSTVTEVRNYGSDNITSIDLAYTVDGGTLVSDNFATNIAPGAAETEFSLVRFKGDVQTANSVYDGFEALLANDVAEAIWFVTSQPAHVTINDITIMPTAQASATILHKK